MNGQGGHTMPSSKRDPTKKIGEISAFTVNAFNFFSNVLKSIATDDFLRVVWGVEVLLFVILAFMILFGSITGDQRFNLALVIIASVVLTFTLTIWRSRGQPAPAARQVAPGSSAASHLALIGQVQKCLMLLTQINDANARIVVRGRSGSGPWAKMLTDTYNHVCDTCYRRRLGTEAADSYFDAICAEPDVITVCGKKWELGEALDDYRKRLNGVSPMPP